MLYLTHAEQRLSRLHIVAVAETQPAHIAVLRGFYLNATVIGFLALQRLILGLGGLIAQCNLFHLLRRNYLIINQSLRTLILLAGCLILDTRRLHRVARRHSGDRDMRQHLTATHSRTLVERTLQLDDTAHRCHHRLHFVGRRRQASRHFHCLLKGRSHYRLRLQSHSRSLFGREHNLSRPVLRMFRRLVVMVVVVMMFMVISAARGQCCHHV